jgi:hypothetical protein
MGISTSKNMAHVRRRSNDMSSSVDAAEVAEITDNSLLEALLLLVDPSKGGGFSSAMPCAVSILAASLPQSSSL